MTDTYEGLLPVLRERISKHEMFCNRFKCDCGADELTARIDALLANGGWIKVSERLPTHLHSVLAVIVDGPFHVPDAPPQIDIASYLPESNQWFQYEGVAEGDASVKVTHWRDLPPLPQENT